SANAPLGFDAQPTTRSSGGAQYQQFLLDNIQQIQQQAHSAAPQSVMGSAANTAVAEQIVPSGLGGNTAAIPDISTAFGQGAGHNSATVSLLQTVDGVRPIQHLLQQFDAPAVSSLTANDFQGVSLLMSAKAESENAGIDSLNAIELVGEIYEFMLSDEQLPDAVKAVLSYLHTPFLKIALTDPDFLRDINHPAKRLLDCLAEAGRKWVNNDGQSQLRIFPKIKEVVRCLMVEFSDNPDVVLTLCNDMESFNQKMDAKVKLLNDRAQAKSEGEEQLRLIKRRAYHEIKALIAGQDLPAPMQVLIFHPMADYLTLMGLRFGVESPEWTSKRALISYLVASVNVEVVTADRASYLMNNAEKCTEVTEILKEIAFDQARSVRLVSLLARAQHCALEEQSFSVDSRDQDLVVDKKKTDALQEEDKATEEEQIAAKYLAGLDFGTWLEFSSPEFTGHKKVKIAWYNAHSDRFMLSDNSGQFRVMRSALDLAKEKLSGRMVIITKNEKPFFERALESVLIKFKQSTMLSA
ncbi:MAG: DUF1631 family protein, partial [Sinobacterium sp.]|nr:DUF1631 family protein [Sinobacterium sp.]